MPLSDVQRADIRGLAAEGQSCTTIAAALGLSVGAVAGSLNGGRHTKVDAALIDRIRLLADEGMDQRRIASTIGLSESTVAKHMPRSLRLVTSTPPPANGSAPVAEPIVEEPSEPAVVLEPELGQSPELVDLPSRDQGDGPPEAPMVPPPANQHRTNIGLESDQHQKGANNMTAVPSVGSGADHASDIPPIMPPAGTIDAGDLDDEPLISPSELRLFLGTPSTDDLRSRYVEALLARTETDHTRDRIERALCIRTADDVDLWAEGYRRALDDILDFMATVDQDRMRSKLTERIARLAISPPMA